MDAVDLERIGIEQHQAEVGLLPADDRRLQAMGSVGAGRIKCRNDFAAAGRARSCPKAALPPADRTSNRDGCSAIRRQRASKFGGLVPWEKCVRDVT